MRGMLTRKLIIEYSNWVRTIMIYLFEAIDPTRQLHPQQELPRMHRSRVGYGQKPIQMKPNFIGELLQLLFFTRQRLWQ